MYPRFYEDLGRLIVGIVLFLVCILWVPVALGLLVRVIRWSLS